MAGASREKKPTAQPGQFELPLSAQTTILKPGYVSVRTFDGKYWVRRYRPALRRRDGSVAWKADELKTFPRDATDVARRRLESAFIPQKTPLQEEIAFAARFLRPVRRPPVKHLPLLDVERMHEMTGYDT